MGWFKDLGREKPWAQGCVIFSAGVALACSSCFGFLFTLDFNGGSSSALAQTLSVCCAILFGAGALALPVGFVWWIVGLVKANARRTAAAAAGTPPPGSDAPAGS
jgi:hypothetical protein